jgi:hypothetical protein
MSLDKFSDFEPRGRMGGAALMVGGIALIAR